MITIIVYSTSTGKEPFTDWFFDLDKKTRSIVETRLDRVSMNNFGDCKPIKGAERLFELRIDYGAGYRVYFGKHKNTIVVLLTGGDKGSQDRDIKKAEKYWLDYKDTL